MRKPRRLAWVALAATAMLAIGGCGSDHSDDSTSAHANQPARGYEAGSVGARLKTAWKELGGNLADKDFRCVFDSAAICVNGRVSGAAKLNGNPCVVDPKLKAAVDRADASAAQTEQSKLLIQLKQEKDECEAKGRPWEWLEGANFCIQSRA